VKKRKRRVFDDYQLPESIKSLSAILSHSIWWQDDRKGVAWRVHATLDKLSEWASQFFGVAFESLMLYRAEEWSKLFETGISVQTETIKAREKLAIFVLNEKGVTEYLGRKAEALKEKYFSVPSVEPGSIKEFNGTKVSVGKVTGRARILFTPKNVISMREGEVLVAPMTSPDYIIAMRKAAAIVTDVGGLMSHAAIVSRELGVPCIVGTKIATKVLKDGDLVEVNANDGIVKIIKKSDKR
jgi:phosphoenolpyruvate synthase/pyruvate phosphate dikinase